MSIIHHNTATLYRAALKDGAVLPNFPLDLMAAEAGNEFRDLITDHWQDHAANLRDCARYDGIDIPENDRDATLKKYYELMIQPVLVVNDQAKKNLPLGMEYRTGTLIFPIYRSDDQYVQVTRPLVMIEEMLTKQYQRVHEDLWKNPPTANDRAPMTEEEKDINPANGLERLPQPAPPSYNLHEERVQATEAAFRAFEAVTGRAKPVVARGHMIYDAKMAQWLENGGAVTDEKQEAIRHYHAGRIKTDFSPN